MRLLLLLPPLPARRERVMPLLQDGMIMITWANHHYLDFARSWVYHIKKVRTALPAKTMV